jgi:long-chain fatty acid transport protein
MNRIGRKLLSVAVAAALGGMATGAAAGGFAIGTQSGSGTGNAFTGGAAAADDASVAWYNPALMTLLPGKQVAGALHILKPSFKFENTSSTAVGNDGGDGGGWAFVPNGFFTMAISPNVSFGLALNVPFGLKTEYDPNWRGRFLAIKSEIKTVNLNPSIAYKVSEIVSIGAGFSYQKLEAQLTNSVLGLGTSNLEADDDGFGYNFGISIQPSPNTRIGAHYRSAIKYDLEGTAKFTVTAGNANVKADLEVPDSASLSLYQKLGPNWELLGDVTWTGWSSIKSLQVICTSQSAACPVVGGPLGGPAAVPTLAFNWKDTWRYGLGANYKMSPQTKLRFGLAFDETPTNDIDRTPRLPDEDRTWVALGVQWKPSKTSILDVGYAHEFIKDASINRPSQGGTVVGTFKNQADILSVQFSMSF